MFQTTNQKWCLIVFNGYLMLFEVMCVVIAVHMINIPYMGHLLTGSW